MAVEQPELHLHPAFQASLGDMFSAAIKRPNGASRQKRFLIETHSEALIGRLSELIAAKELSVDDVIIYFVEKDEAERNSSVRVGSYDPDGNISNWPLGFFSGSI
ncbi:hypothetical protein D3C85_1305380 [compost metagenome]